MNKCPKTYTGKHNFEVVEEHIETIQIGDDVTTGFIPGYIRCFYCGIFDDRKQRKARKRKK